MTKLEKETTIVYNEEEDVATIWTASNKVKTLMKRLGVKPTRTSNLGAWYEVQKKQITIAKLRKKRVLSDKERKVLSERMRKNVS